MSYKITTVPLDFAQARECRDRLDAEYQRTSDALRALSGGGTMNLTPDHVRATVAWQSAKVAYEQAFAALRAFNAVYVKRFKREIVQERRARGR